MHHKNHRLLVGFVLLTLLLLFGSAAGSAGQNARGVTELSPYRWHTFYGSAPSDGSYGIASAEDGSIYLTGECPANWLGDNGEEPIHSFTTGFDDLVVMKLDSAGTYQWHTFYGSSDQDGGDKIALDGDGGIYIYGFSYESWLGDDGEEALHSFTPGGSNIFVLKLDSNGAYQWHTFYGPILIGGDIVASSTGAIYITGGSTTNFSGDDGAQPLHPRSGGEDIFVLKLDSDGDYQWHTFYGSSASDNSRGIDVDDNGDLYVAGASYQSWLGDNGVNPIHAHSSTGDIVIMKLDEDGGYLWHTFYGGSIGDLGQGISAANDGFIYITGYSFLSWLGDDGQEPLHLFSEYYLHSDFVVLKLDQNGVYQWHTFYGSYDYDHRGRISTGEDGSIYITGESASSWLGDGEAEPIHPHSGYVDIIILKLDSSGAYRWHTFYGTLEFEWGSDIKTYKDGSIYISAIGGEWLGDGGAAPLHPSSGSADLTILKLWDRLTPKVMLSSQPNPSTFQQEVTFTAAISHTWSITPTGVVTFTEGENLLGTGLLNPDGVATYITSTLEIGEHPITVEYSGDDTYYGSTSETLTHTVSKAETFSILISSPNPSVYGESVTFTATVTSTIGITPTGMITFTQDGSPLSTGMLDGSGMAVVFADSLTAGEHLITAEYAGDALHAGSTSAPLVQVVNKAETVSILTSSPNPSIYGESVTFTATVTSTTGITLTGVVTFTDGENLLGTGLLNPVGVATYITSTLETGEHLILAEYGGDNNYYGSTSETLTHTVNKADTLSSLISSPNPSIFGESVTFTATVTSTGGITPTGIVSFTADNSPLGIGLLDSDGIAVLEVDAFGAGVHLIMAEYGGDESYYGSASETLTHTVNKAETLSVLASSPNPSVFGESVTFTVTVTSASGISPSGMVSLMEEEIILGTGVLDGSGITTIVVPLLEVGEHAIYAAYVGDANFLPGSSAVLVQVVEAQPIEARVYLPVIQR